MCALKLIDINFDVSEINLLPLKMLKQRKEKIEKTYF